MIPDLTAEFKKKWSRYQGKETSAYQGISTTSAACSASRRPPKPIRPAAISSASKSASSKTRSFSSCTKRRTPASRPNAALPTFGKRAASPGNTKAKRKTSTRLTSNLLRYRESLLNPPLLVVCDFDRYIVKTNFNGTVQEVHEFTNDQIDRPENLRILRALFENPDFLKPQRTTAQVTEKVAGQIAEVAKSLQKRESVELADARPAPEVNVAQRKNLRIARFLNRIVFCFFRGGHRLAAEKSFQRVAQEPALTI